MRPPNMETVLKKYPRLKNDRRVQMMTLSCGHI